MCPYCLPLSSLRLPTEGDAICGEHWPPLSMDSQPLFSVRSIIKLK